MFLVACFLAFACCVCVCVFVVACLCSPGCVDVGWLLACLRVCLIGCVVAGLFVFE